MARLLYRRGAPLIAVRHVNLGSGRTLEPGDDVPSDLREYHKRSLWLRRVVALKGCPWGAGRLGPLAAPEPVEPPEPEPSDEE